MQSENYGCEVNRPYKRAAKLAGALLVLLQLVALVPQVMHAQAAAIFRSANAILSLSPEKAKPPAAAHLQGVVTVVGQGGLFLQDASAGIWIFCPDPFRMHTGDEIVVDGLVGPGTYSPVVNARSVRWLGRSALPRPIPVTFAQLSSGDFDSQFVSVQGWIRAAGMRPSEPRRSWIKLQLPGGLLYVSLPLEELERSKKLIGSYVRLQSVASCTKNAGRQITSPTLVVSNLDSLKVLQQPPHDLFTAPYMAIGSLMQFRSGAFLNKRVKVEGTVTAHTPGQGLIIEDGGHALSISSMQTDAVRLGERIEAVGFPALTPTGPELQDTLFRSLGNGQPVQPSSVTSEELSEGSYNNTLVSIEGKLVRRVLEPGRLVLLIQTDSSIVLAELATTTPIEKLRNLSEGARVRVTGICVLGVQGTWNLGPTSSYTISYRILLRQPGDVIVLRPPSWWTTRRLISLSAFLAIVVLALVTLGIYGRIRHWRLKMVLRERERFSHEMHDTLAQGFAGLGFQLQAIRRDVPAHMPGLRAQVDLASKLARHSHKEALGSFEPMLPAIEEIGELLSSLEATANQLTKAGGVAVSTRRAGAPIRLPAKLEEALRRTGQEAIANAVRHANPTQIELSLEYLAESVRLSVRDNGCGFVKSGGLLGFGLNGMRRRAAAVQGDIEINTQPGAGTTVTLTVPLPRRITLWRARLALLASAKRTPHARIP